MIRLRMAGLAVLATVLAFPGTHAPATDAPSAPSAPLPGADLDFMTLDGEAWSLADAPGHVLLDFMDPFCTPCRQQMTLLAQVHVQGPALGVSLVSMDVGAATSPDASHADLRAFRDEHEAPWPFIPDVGGRAAVAYQAHVVPTLVLLDGGVEVARWVGVGVSLEDIRAAIARP